jgi:Na+/H+-dicarboxylate symporter
MTTLAMEKLHTKAWWKELWVQVLIAMAFTTIALVIALIMVNLLKPGAAMNIDPGTINADVVEPYVKQTAVVGFVPFLMNIIPGTFVGAFAEGNILQVLFISVMCAIPVTSVALVLGIHRLMSQTLTPTNLIGNALATIVVATWEDALDETRMKQVLNGEALVPALV